MDPIPNHPLIVTCELILGDQRFSASTAVSAAVWNLPEGRAYTEQFLRSRVGEAVLDRIPPTFTVYDEAPEGHTITAERPAAAAQED